MPMTSSSSFLPSPSPSSSSLRSSDRPYPFSIASKNTSSTSLLASIDYSRPSLQRRDASLSESGPIRLEQPTYSRRQLSIEAVYCVFVDDSNTSGPIYTFRVKPSLLQTGRKSTRMKAPRRSDNSRHHHSEQDTRAEEQDSDMEEIPFIEPYQIDKSSRELLELSNRLFSSFDMLLDPKRGGPPPLTKEFLLPKWHVKDMFRRKKKTWSIHEAQLAEATSVAKQDIINDFFDRILKTGGEVLSSSRAMQDFFDKNQSLVLTGYIKSDIPVTVTPPRPPPPRPSLSALRIDTLPDYEATEQLTGSPFYQYTPLSTPISAAKSETRPKLWKRLQGDEDSTPTGQVRPGMYQSASYNAEATSLCDMQQAEIMSVAQIDNNGAIDSKSTSSHLHSLTKSISQQDLRSDLATWRQEVNRASLPRARKTSESSSLMKLSLDGRQQGVPSSPDSILSRHSAQLRQVSAIAVKAKASGWKITKGSSTPIKWGNSKSACAERTHFQSDSPSRTRGRDVGKTSKTSTTTSTSENRTYVPSELEKLIFGNGSQFDNHSSSSLTLPQARQVQQRNITADVESLQGNEEEEEFVDQDNSSTSIDHQSTSSSTRSGSVASYKVKGRAAALRLNLSGQSNLHSESMMASSSASTSNRPPVKSSQSDRSLQIHTAISNNDSTFDPDMSLQSAQSQSSAVSNKSPFKYSTIETTQKNSTPSFVANENNNRAEKGHLHYLTVDSSVQGSSSDEAGAIEREVQLWKERRSKPRKESASN